VQLRKTIEIIKAEITSFEITSNEALESFRISFLGSKNKIKGLFVEFKALPPEEKKALGQVLNELKKLAEER
jgi:phenylalanyl-tRNA synthetase alpha chain